MRKSHTHTVRRKGNCTRGSYCCVLTSKEKIAVKVNLLKICVHQNLPLKSYIYIDYVTVHYHSVVYTSSAVLATASKPTYAKKTVAEPASIPSTPKGKYLLIQKGQVLTLK